MTRLHWKVTAGMLVAGALMAWGYFHPPFRPDASAVTAAVRAGLAQTGFTSTRGVSITRLETVESDDGSTESWNAEQVIAPVDGLLTEKLTQRTTKGGSEETSALYAGPIVVIRHYRSRPPFVADLLPYHFWSSMRLSDFTVVHVDRFPHTKGGELRARLTYEEHYDGGQLAQTERRQLRCSVAETVDAASINPALPGRAARIECHEELEPDGRQWGPTNPRTQAMGRLSYSHWYILSSGWSIPIEGESAILVGGIDTTRRWKTKLVSFESRGRE